MLSTDEIIYSILINEKKNGNQILKHFQISYPSKKVASESNSIFIGAVSSEIHTEMTDASEYKDLTEILITTKIKDYKRAIFTIKTVSKEIIKIIKENTDSFPFKPIIRNIAPEYNPSFVLNRGHIMIECLTELEEYNNDEESIEKVCKILLNDIEVE
ncbi:MAG: hypothetical protein IJH63_03115 [Methanobrevibacter sp.]|nr:hypothetical protein [Methanobrevibacter sp.]